MTKVFVMTLAQRLCMFAVTWIVYKSYGLSGGSIIDIVTMQVMIAVAVEMLPLPGAAGITEASFLIVFDNIFGAELVKPALLLSRGLSFYAVLIAVCMVLPLLYIGRHNIPLGIYPYVFQGFLILLAVLFVMKIKVNKPPNKGLLVMFTLGLIIFLGYLKMDHLI